MRLVPVTTLAVFSALVVCAPASATSVNEKAPDPQAIAALETRASQAQPREQCFLYAELVHQMIELAGRQLSDGETDKASLTIHSVQQYAQKIHLAVADDNKRLKNAEILLRHTAFRLKEILNGASLDDRPMLEATLVQLNQVENEAMMQVFRK